LKGDDILGWGELWEKRLLWDSTISMDQQAMKEIPFVGCIISMDQQATMGIFLYGNFSIIPLVNFSFIYSFFSQS
jgi:hypothetical protein